MAAMWAVAAQPYPMTATLYFVDAMDDVVDVVLMWGSDPLVESGGVPTPRHYFRSFAKGKPGIWPRREIQPAPAAARRRASPCAGPARPA
jgi:hypothetical protein